MVSALMTWGLLVALTVSLVGVRVVAGPEEVETIHYVQYGVLVATTLFWTYASTGVSKPSAMSISQEKQRLQQALPEAGATGLTEHWFETADQLIRQIKTSVAALLVVAVGASIATCFPDSAFDVFGAKIQKLWADFEAKHDDETLFVWGIFGIFMTTFWTCGAVYAVLDLTIPEFAKPYKTQEYIKVTKSQFATACAVALGNQLVLLACIYGVWFLTKWTATNPFGEIPSAVSIFLQIMVSAPFTEIIFYNVHRLLHHPWLFKHIHYFHHTWTAPISITCIYAHPVEFILGNVTLVACGPLVQGSHVVVWYIWTVVATLSTMHGHSGWHLPILGSNEAHDFHHLQGEDNLGNLGILDELNQTNLTYKKSWQQKIDQNYSTPDYPVDKVLSRANQQDILAVKKAAAVV